MPRLRLVLVPLLLWVAALAGCAPAAPAPAAPAPEQPPSILLPSRPMDAAPSIPAATPQLPDALAPDPAAVRTSERVQLTGTELGTMWTFENPPLDYWQRTYGFTATPQWLEHVRLSSVRYGEICSASFVSPSGLVMTNHHCARECTEAVSTSGQDYVASGFYAATRAQEKLCPDLYLDQLVETRDVTERVRGAAPAGASDTELAAAREAEEARIVAECGTAADTHCQVVELYHGGQYHLYRYHRFQPVKLVFVPELAAGFFGGDPDNFTYPRYALDVAFVRAYQPGGIAPVQSGAHYFRWSPRGASEGDLAFVTGNPGSTTRLATVAQLMFDRQMGAPFIIDYLEGWRGALQEVAALGPERERAVRQQLFSIENSLKAYGGQLGGLRDTVLMGRKIRWERELRGRVEADPQLRSQYGDVWDRLAELQRRKLALQPRVYLSSPTFAATPYLQTAAQLARFVRLSGVPEAQRPESLRGEAWAKTEQELLLPGPLDPELGRRMVRLRLELARRWLPAGDPLLGEALRPGEAPEAAARRLLEGSRIGDVAFRRALIAAGPAALDTVSDPLVRLAVRMLATTAEVVPEWQQIGAAEEVQQSRLARALFAVHGTALPPDATFTLRITDGVVRGYPYNGTVAPWRTSIYGLYERSVNFGNRDPFTLPTAFARNRARIDLGAPLDFVTTNDITGGNSGSPMIDREARVVGIAFDSNIEGLPNEYLFTTEAARTVGVHSAGILEALRNAYGAAALVSELMGTR